MAAVVPNSPRSRPACRLTDRVGPRGRRRGVPAVAGAGARGATGSARRRVGSDVGARVVGARSAVAVRAGDGSDGGPAVDPDRRARPPARRATTIAAKATAIRATRPPWPAPSPRSDGMPIGHAAVIEDERGGPGDRPWAASARDRGATGRRPRAASKVAQVDVVGVEAQPALLLGGEDGRRRDHRAAVLARGRRGAPSAVGGHRYGQTVSGGRRAVAGAAAGGARAGYRPRSSR